MLFRSVGAGNAAACAALAARDGGASVLMIDAAPQSQSGGNTRYTAGAMRVVFNGVDDLVQLMPDLTEDERTNVNFGTYTDQQYFDDMARVTQYRADPDLVELLQVLCGADVRLPTAALALVELEAPWPLLPAGRGVLHLLVGPKLLGDVN